MPQYNTLHLCHTHPVPNVTVNSHLQTFYFCLASAYPSLPFWNWSHLPYPVGSQKLIQLLLHTNISTSVMATHGDKC